MKRGPVIALVALIAVLVLAFAGYEMLAVNDTAKKADETAQVKPSANTTSQAAPASLADYDVSVYTEDGQATTLTEIAGGKPLVVNFWATWCPYCIQEMPDYQALVREYDGRVAFAFVDCADGARETVEMGAAWLADNGFTDLPAFYDQRQRAQYTFGISALPTTIVASAQGEIIAVTRGAINPDRMRELLDSLA